jgi:outer membrane murein-binding lipoprotein Lpp
VVTPLRAAALASVLLGGCASTTPTADKAATAALAQLVAYEGDLAQKLRAENDYYTNAMDAAAKRVTDFWESEQSFRFNQDAKVFTEANADATADALKDDIVSFMDGSVGSWSSRGQEYEDLLVGTEQILRDDFQKLEIKRGEIRSLRATLQNLSEGRDTREMLLLAATYAREVGKRYGELKAAAPQSVEQEPAE